MRVIHILHVADEGGVLSQQEGSGASLNWAKRADTTYPIQERLNCRVKLDTGSGSAGRQPHAPQSTRHNASGCLLHKTRRISKVFQFSTIAPRNGTSRCSMAWISCCNVASACWQSGVPNQFGPDESDCSS